MEQTQYEYSLIICTLFVITHPFALGFGFTVAPSQSVFEAYAHLGWITLEVKF